jgi:predicted deacylase
MAERGSRTVIGSSVNGTAITAYHFGTGDEEVLLVGGTHGSYSPNTSALALEAIDYFVANVDAIPTGVMLTIIPTLNPDGLAMTGTAGRFNTNDVDLNRNFDCEWSATGMWQDQEVSGGAAAFSEPEAAALRDYVEEYNPNAAIVLFGAEGKVYPSACGSTPSSASVALAATYATAANYPADATFDAYAITGDMVNWMAKQGIPSISVLLSNHQNTEWSKNKAGIEAVLKTYAE